MRRNAKSLGARQFVDEPEPSTPPEYTEVLQCRLCAGKLGERVLDLGVQTLPNYVTLTPGWLPMSPLLLVRCTACGLLQLGHKVAADLMWKEYWYRSGVNQTMRQALDDVVRNGLTFAKAGTWVDIGANDGTLLSHVPATFRKIGFEPALNLAPLLEEHADLVYTDYFKAQDGLTADVVTSCAMFYDLNDPKRFAQDVADTLTDEGVWINQLADAPTMLKSGAFDQICHEHATYLDIYQLNEIYKSAGLHIVSVSHNNVNGGSIRVAAMKKPARDPQSVLMGMPASAPELVNRFAAKVKRWRAFVQEELVAMTDGDHWAYGASTKGSVMLQYLNFQSDCVTRRFVGVAERNPAKYGLRMAGLNLPITDEATMRKAEPGYLWVLPWAFEAEFVEREAALLDKGTRLILPLPQFKVYV